MLIGLTLVFGAIIILDNISNNSARAKRKRAEAEKQAELHMLQVMRRCDNYAEEQIALWKKSGLPPHKWK